MQGGTVIGPPHKVEDLGETEVPEEVFHDYLKDISDQFRFSLIIAPKIQNAILTLQ